MKHIVIHFIDLVMKDFLSFMLWRWFKVRNRIKGMREPLVEAWIIRLSQGEMLRWRLLTGEGCERHQRIGGGSKAHVRCAKARQNSGWSGESCCRGAEGSQAGWVTWRHVRKHLGNQAIFRLDIIRSFLLGHKVGTLKRWERSHHPVALLPHTRELLESHLSFIVFASSLLPFAPSTPCNLEIHQASPHHSHHGHQRLPESQALLLFSGCYRLDFSAAIDAPSSLVFATSQMLGTPQIYLQLGLSSGLLT